MKRLDMVKENDRVFFKYNHNRHVIKNEANTKTVTIDGKPYNLKKPFKNINAFYRFCVNTALC